MNRLFIKTDSSGLPMQLIFFGVFQTCVQFSQNYKQYFMTYLIKYFLRALLLFSLMTVLIEIVRALYLQHSINADTFWPGLFTHFCNQSTLNIREFIVVKWGFWLFSYKPYYIVLVLIGCILYYKSKKSNLKQPLIITHETTPADRYQQFKKQNTERELRKLKESPQYQKYRRDVLFEKLPYKEDDETIAELREKQAELF